jgi:PIN domain nuclease of toxin-antitoxin system
MIVLDTHVLVWWADGEAKKLSRKARQALEQHGTLTAETAERAGQFGDTFPGDPADRMIAATALLREVPLVTHDEKLLGVDYLKTIW